MKRSVLDRNNFVNTYSRIFDGKILKYVTFIVTHNCNLQCSYCYEHNKSDKEMSFDIAKRCVDLLFYTDSKNGIWINEEECHGIVLDFIGGEPFLKIELIDQIMDYFLEKAIQLNHRWMIHYMINMATNGMLYETEAVQDFLKKWEGRVSISVTIDGDRDTHNSCRVDSQGRGSYDIASAAFEDLLKKYRMDGTKFTIAPGNINRVFIAHSDMIERYGITRIMSNCVYEKGWGVEHATTLYYELKKLTDWLIGTHRELDVDFSIMDNFIGKPMPDDEIQNWCGGTGKMLAFDIDGTIIPCMRYSPISLGEDIEPLIVGHINTGIGVTDEQLTTVNMLESITRQTQSTEECLRCPIAFGCAWCSAYNYEINGTPDQRVTAICDMHKARVMATAYYFNSIYRHHNIPDRFPMNIPVDWALEILPKEEYDMLLDLSK